MLSRPVLSAATKVHCPRCLTRKHRNSETSYHYASLAAVLLDSDQQEKRRNRVLAEVEGEIFGEYGGDGHQKRLRADKWFGYNQFHIENCWMISGLCS